MGGTEAGQARKEIKSQPVLCVCARERARSGGGQGRARSRLGSSPGFAGCRCRGEAALSLPVSGSQASGSVGPAARAEERERSLAAGSRRGPERLLPPAAGEARRGYRLHVLEPWDLQTPGAALRPPGPPFVWQVNFTPRTTAPAPPQGVCGALPGGGGARAARAPVADQPLEWPRASCCEGEAVSGRKLGKRGLGRARRWVFQCPADPRRMNVSGFPGIGGWGSSCLRCISVWIPSTLVASNSGNFN